MKKKIEDNGGSISSDKKIKTMTVAVSRLVKASRD